MRSRRPRTFEDLYNKPAKKQGQASSVFDYEQLEQQSDAVERHQKEDKRLQKREERNAPRQSYTDKKSSSYIIHKAREVPSAIHGTRKKQIPVSDGTDEKADVPDNGYRSSIIEEIKRERLRKQKRYAAHQDKNSRAQNYRKPILQTSSVFLNPTQQQLNENKTSNSKKEPEQVQVQAVQTSTAQENRALDEKKRVGPKFSYPSLHLLGPVQNENYNIEDTKVTEKILNAFNAIAMPVEKVNYYSNGMFGNYELRVKSTLRIGQLNQLKVMLAPYMDEMHFRITTDKLSSGIINIEVPLIKKNIITFNTLFNASSLRVRKNDFKIALGKTLEDRAFSFTLTKAGHILLYGGRDDSVNMVVDNVIVSLMMNHTPYDLKLHFITEKSSYNRYLDTPYVYETKQDISGDDAFDSILSELTERQNQFRRAQVRNIASFNTRVGPQFRKSIILVIVDDLHTILKEKNSYAYNALLQLLTKGKSLGIHCIVRQSDISFDLRFELIRLLQTRISFFDPMHRIITGTDELSEHRADCLVQLPTTSKPTRVTLGTISERVHNDIITHVKTPNLT